MSERDCTSNVIKQNQDLIKLFYFDNMPAKFNRVLGVEVDVEDALQCLNQMVEMHMSEAEGDVFLAFKDRIITKRTGEVFAMPIRSKTLRLAFLGKADSFFLVQQASVFADFASIIERVYERVGHFYW